MNYFGSITAPDVIIRHLPLAAHSQNGCWPLGQILHSPSMATDKLTVWTTAAPRHRGAIGRFTSLSLTEKSHGRMVPASAPMKSHLPMTLSHRINKAARVRCRPSLDVEPHSTTSACHRFRKVDGLFTTSSHWIVRNLNHRDTKRLAAKCTDWYVCWTERTMPLPKGLPCRPAPSHSKSRSPPSR